MSRYILHLDVSGRISRSTDGHEIVTVGGFSLETAKLKEARDNLPQNLPKWEKATISDVSRVSAFICKYAAYCLAVRVEKNTEEWPLFWDNAEKYHQGVASATKMRTGFIKAANVIRYWLFERCSVPLLAETLKRCGESTILDPDGLRIIEVGIVCDSDIQGKDNIEAFRECWEQFERSQVMTKQRGLRIVVGELSVLSEGAEPLLLIADYIAGICNALFGAGKVSTPLGLDLDGVKTELDKVKDAGKIVVIGEKFDLDYKDIFGKLAAIL